LPILSNASRRCKAGGVTPPLPELPQVHLPRLVVRLVGSELDSARERLATVQVSLLENLDEAVAQAVRLSKSGAKK